MDSKTALDNIKQTEQQAQYIIELAKKEAQEILASAKIQADLIIREAKDRAKIDSQKLKEKIHQEAFKEVVLIQDQAKKASEGLIEKAQGHIDKAARFIKTKIE